jgi:hypothetical protein
LGKDRKLLEDRPGALRAHEPGLASSARRQHAIREHVPPLVARHELNLVNGDEVSVHVARHRLDRRDPIARGCRDALLLPRDQRDLPLAHARRDAVVDLAREQAQRQPHYPRVVFEHPLDRAVGLAGVGRPQECDDGLGGRHFSVGVGGGRMASPSS